MNKNWTYEETVLALYLYCIIPFNKVSSKHSDIIKLSGLINRSPNSIKMKIGNFGSFDPLLKERGIVGLSNVSKLDKEVWDKFNGNWELLVESSDRIMQEIDSGLSIDGLSGDNFPKVLPTETITSGKQRLNQNFFRKTVLSSYNYTCCITRINIPELLVASHIIPWSKNEKQRLNPQNGICLNSLHDKAFDRGLITILPSFKILISPSIKKIKQDNKFLSEFLKIEGEKIFLPERFPPLIEFLEYHNQNIFQNE